ncbi:MAG: pitrilysin family protein [Thermoanaerobaculia bacterium]
MASARFLRAVFTASLLVPASTATHPAAAAAPATPAAPVQGASVEGITEYDLANGLRVLLFPDASKPTTTVNVTYLVGSRHEGYGETGMAHLLEHMVFKGSPKHTNIPQELTSHGARPNGSTWYDRTNYYETFAASDENLAWALDLEADRMVGSFVRKSDLDSEMTVVRNEFESGENSPQGVLEERVLSTMYLWHNYGKSTIGSRADIEKVPIDRLQAFYRKYYQPDNAVLVVAGKFDTARALELAAKTFGAIPRPARVLDTTWTTEPAQDGERAVTLRRVGDVQSIAVGYHVPAGSDGDFAAVEVLSDLMSDTPAGRLHKALVTTQLASSVGGWTKEGHDPSFLILSADVRKERSLSEAKDRLLATADGFAASPATDSEVERAKASLLKQWESTMRNSERAAIAISEWIGVGDWRLLFLHRDRLEKVTAADVQRVALAYLKPENRTVGLFEPTSSPQRAEIPSPPDVALLTRDYAGRKAMDAGEDFDPAPAAIEARLDRRALCSGMNVVLLPKNTRGDTVNLSFVLDLGDETSLQGRRLAGELTARMLLRGSAKHSREEIQSTLDGLRTQMNINGGASQVVISLETTRPNLEAALRLLAEVLRQPAFATAEFEILRQETLAELEDSKAEPQQRASEALGKYLRPWPASDPRYTPSVEEQIAGLAKVTAADAQTFYRDFYGASASELAIVGDFDGGKTAGLLSELFCDWKSAKAFTRLPTPFVDRPAKFEKIETPDKENAIFIAAQRLSMQDTDPDFPALTMGNFLTGGGFLNSRLAQRLRQKEGLSYGAGSQFQASAWEKDGAFTAFAIYAPQNGVRLKQAFEEEIAKIQASGFTEAEVNEARKGWLQGRQVSRGTDRELARLLTTRTFQHRTLAFDEDIDRRVTALSAADVSAVVKRYFDVSKMTIVQAGDFAKSAAAEPAATAGTPAAPPPTGKKEH